MREGSKVRGSCFECDDCHLADFGERERGWCFRGGATNKRYQKKVSLTFGCVLLGNATFGSI